MTQTLTQNQAKSAPDLSYKPFQRRNISSGALSFLAALFAVIAVLPLILVLGYVLVQGGSKISLALLTQRPTRLGGRWHRQCDRRNPGGDGHCCADCRSGGRRRRHFWLNTPDLDGSLSSSVSAPMCRGAIDHRRCVHLRHHRHQPNPVRKCLQRRRRWRVSRC